MLFPQWRQAGLVAGLVFFVLPALVHGQAAGTVTGKIVDQQGGYLPGVEIVLKDDATGTIRKTAADDTGVFTLAGLPPGRYTFRARLDSFKTYSRPLDVAPGRVTRADATLELRAIDVEGPIVRGDEPPLVEPYRAALGLLIPTAI